jgi:hypothetical protein
MKKLLLSGLVALTSALLATGSANAQVTVQGSVTGAFDNGVTGLSFQGNDAFSVTTHRGTPPSAYTNLPVNYGWDGYAGVNLGTFTITGDPAGVEDGTTGTFNLSIDFTAPIVSAADPALYDPAQFQAEVEGQISSSDSDTGGVFVVHFNQTTLSPIPFTYNGSPAYLVLTPDDVTIDPQYGTTKTLTGKIATAVAPEPGSLALILPALMPLGLTLRRRKS